MDRNEKNIQQGQKVRKEFALFFLLRILSTDFFWYTYF